MCIPTDPQGLLKPYYHAWNSHLYCKRSKCGLTVGLLNSSREHKVTIATKSHVDDSDDDEDEIEVDGAKFYCHTCDHHVDPWENVVLFDPTRFIQPRVRLTYMDLVTNEFVLGLSSSSCR